MALLGSGVEYAMHCLLLLVGQPAGHAASSRDLAAFQGVSPSYVAKLFTQLQKAGLVAAAEGVRGGFRLARPAERITVLDVVDALEGDKPLFLCREIRRNCVLYADDPPDWATRGICAIHAVMRTAEARMRDSLRGTTLAELASTVDKKVPTRARAAAGAWFQARAAGRVRHKRKQRGEAGDG